MEYRKVTELKLLENNPRTITEEQFDKLKTSIKNNKDYFEARPIILSDRTGELVVIGGNQRLKAAKALNIEEVPTFLLHGLTEEREKEITIRDNVQNGDWNYDLLANEWNIEDLNDWGVENLKQEEKTDDEKIEELEDDEIEDLEEKKTDIKQGDIFKLGNHRLMCGDSTNENDVYLLMNGEKADLVLTDPPYNIDYAAKNKYLNKCDKGNRIDNNIKNDALTDEEFNNFLKKVFDNYNKIVLKDGGVIYCFYATIETLNFLNNFKDIFYFSQILIWSKNNWSLSLSDYQHKYEPILYGWKKGKHYFINDRSQSDILDLNEKDLKKFTKEQLLKIIQEFLNNKTDIINCDKPVKSTLHPTMKPLKLLGRLISNSSMQGQLITDLFGGSGSTLITCEQLNRRCNMMELDPLYCQVIIDRWEKLTGKKAIKIN